MSKSIFTIQHFYTKFLGILTLILCLSFCVSAQNIGHEQREAEYQPYAPALAKHYHNLTFADITGRASGTSTQIDHEWEYLSSSDPCAEIDNIVLDFDGTDDRVELGNFSFYQDNFTIEGWINSSQTNDATLFHVYDGLNSGIFIGRTGNSIRFIVRNPPNNSGGAFRIGTTNVFDGNWHHFAAVKGSDNRLYLYIDGVLEGSNSGTIGDFGSNVYDVVLGYNNPNSPRYYNGQMDEVRLWNIERTQTEIQNNKDMELTGSETGLVAYYDFNQGIPDANNTSETTLLDRTTNGNDGTLTNFSLTAGTVSNWTSPGPFTTGGALILSLTNDSPACAGDDITFVAMGNGANNYEFFLDADMDGEVDNGESLQNGASNTYVSSTLSDGDVISVLGSRTSGCTAVATSTVTVNASPTITSFNNDSPVCAGEAITFTANASEASNYEFFSDIDMDGEVDGGESLQTGASDTYTTSSLNDGDVISVLVTATSGCTAIATSTVTINTNPSLSLSNSGSACASDTITFTATGGLANYDFFLDENTNGALDAGELLQSSTSNILKINNLIDGDIIGVLASDVNTCTAIATSTASVDAFDLSGIDNALNLDGSDDYVDIPSATNMPQGNAPRTMEAWVKTTQTSIGNIISWGTRSTRQRNGLAVRDGKLAFIGQFHDFRGKITINDGEWHHLVITYDGTNWRLFVDGNEDEKVRQFGDPFNDELNTVGNNLRIGLISQPSVGEYYNGTVDEVRIWNYARSTAQILASKDVELTGNETGLLAYYKFNQGTADADNTGQTTLLDFTSNTSNGTLLNFTLNGSTSNWTSSRASLPINNVALSNSGPVCPGEDITFSATKGASNYEFFDDANQNGLIDVGESLQNGISRLYTTNTFTDGDTISVLATDPNGCTTVVTSIARTSDFALLSGGNALDFDGENDYVDAGNILTSSYTKEVWVNIDLSNGLANNLLSGSNTQAQHIFWTPAIYGYRVSAGHNGDWGAVRDAEPIPAGWQHYAVTYDAPTTSMKLYRNGNLVAENDNVPNYMGGNQVLIGAFENNNLFGGRLDEVRIWDYARTEAEIKTQREVALTGSETGLIAYYDFNQGIPNDNNTGQTTLLDRSTNSNNATLVNFSLGAGKNSNWTNSDAPIEVTDLQVVNNSPVCDGEAVSFTVSEGALNYEFFLDANTNGLVDNGESLQSGSGNTYVDSSLVSGDVMSILLTDTKGCTTVITSTPTIQPCGSTGFIVTYRTTSPNELIRIPTIPFGGFVYNYSVDWGDGTSDTGLTGDANHIYAVPDLYTVSIEGEFPGIFFDDNSSSRRKIQSIKQWGDIEWESFQNAFEGCINLTYDATDKPNLSNVKSMRRAFQECTAFNGDIGDWDMSNVEDISSMFREATSFNQDLSDWDVSNVESMQGTFYEATAFNQSLGDWDLTGLRDNGLFNMLSYCGMNTENYDATLMSWATQEVENIRLGASRLKYCAAKAARTELIEKGWQIRGDGIDGEACGNNIPFVTTWETSLEENSIRIYTSPGYVYAYTVDWGDGTIEQNLTDDRTHIYTDGETEHTVSITGIFPSFSAAGLGVSSFSGRVSRASVAGKSNAQKLKSVEDWGGQQWRSMVGTFAYTDNVQINAVDPPDLSQAINMSAFAFEAYEFNADISDWDVSKMQIMDDAFDNARSFNIDIGRWEVSNVRSMREMFKQASTFNQDLGNWAINNWVKQRVRILDSDTGRSTRFSFSGGDNMLNFSGLDVENYDNTLIGWRLQDPSFPAGSFSVTVRLGASNLRYCNSADARDYLINTSNLDIRSDSEDPNCTTSSALSTDDPIPATEQLEQPLSLDPFQAAMEVYPNPASEQVRIAVNTMDSKLRTLVIRNQLGSVIWSRTLADAENTIQLSLESSLFPAGIYTISLQLDEQILTKQLVVVK